MSEYQLGAYYDIRYVQYFVRYKFLLGLSKYNEDDTILEREKKIKAAEKEYINYPVSDWITQKTESEGKKMDERSPDNCVFHTIGEMSRYLGKTGILDKVVDEYLLSTYIDIDEQEFQVCKCVFWTIHDIGVADYIEVVTRILLHRIKLLNHFLLHIPIMLTAKATFRNNVYRYFQMVLVVLNQDGFSSVLCIHV
jgi:hypothetical protein